MSNERDVNMIERLWGVDKAILKELGKKLEYNEKKAEALADILGTLIAEIEYDGEATKKTIEKAKQLLNQIGTK
jgi:dsRNA-specific ribonuclease